MTQPTIYESMLDRAEAIEHALQNEDVDALTRLKNSSADPEEYETITHIIRNLDTNDWAYDQSRDNQA